MKICYQLIIIAFVALSSATAVTPQQIENTKDIYRSSVAKYLNQHIKTLSIHGNIALIKSDGDVYQSTAIGKQPAGFTDNFELHNYGDYFTSDYGHRTMKERTTTSFWFEKITPQDVYIRYRVYFTKLNGILHIDEGVLTLKSKGKDA